MKKYILTDAAGRTAAGHPVVPGKRIHSARFKKDDPLFQIIAAGHNQELLALLDGAAAAADGSRLFLIQTWTVNVDARDPKAYTVIREVPLPEVSLEQKLGFAVAASARLLNHGLYGKWAALWLSGDDRGADTASHMRAILEDELKTAAGGKLPATEQLRRLGQQSVALDSLQRALHVTGAAVLAATSPVDEKAVLAEIARAVSGLEHYDKQLDLARLCQETLNPAAENGAEGVLALAGEVTGS